MLRPKLSQGGFREGSGRKPKDAKAGPRKTMSVRVHPNTPDLLRQLVASGQYVSQGEAIDYLAAAAVRGDLKTAGTIRTRVPGSAR